MKFTIHQSPANGQWYWHLKARNGRIVADGGEGYMRRAQVVNILRRIFKDSPLETQVEKAAKV